MERLSLLQVIITRVLNRKVFQPVVLWKELPVEEEVYKKQQTQIYKQFCMCVHKCVNDAHSHAFKYCIQQVPCPAPPDRLHSLRMITHIYSFIQREPGNKWKKKKKSMKKKWTPPKKNTSWQFKRFTFYTLRNALNGMSGETSD